MKAGQMVSGGFVAALMLMASAAYGGESLEEAQRREMLWRCASFQMITAPDEAGMGVSAAMSQARRSADASETANWLLESSDIYGEVADELKRGGGMQDFYFAQCRRVFSEAMRLEEGPILSPPLPSRAASNAGGWNARLTVRSNQKVAGKRGGATRPPDAGEPQKPGANALVLR